MSRIIDGHGFVEDRGRDLEEEEVGAAKRGERTVVADGRDDAKELDGETRRWSRSVI